MNQVFTHPGQPEMQAEVILASTSKDSPPIYTVRGRYPRCIHAEVMTHRVFGRNARSSRAVPVEKMIQEVRERPFVPWHWLANQPGMQGGEVWNEEINLYPWDNFDDEDSCRVSRYVSPEEAWRSAARDAVYHAECFAEADYHKQLVNRLLEPFMWIDVLITATDWENFFWLREHKDAEPHLQDWARLVDQALAEAEIRHLDPGEWHTPYVYDTDEEDAQEMFGHSSLGFKTEEEKKFLNKISAARCARISYKPFDGSAPDIAKDLALYDKLIGGDRIHASPLEHQATPDYMETRFIQVNGGAGELLDCWENPKLHGNLTGWIQFRKLIQNEAVQGCPT